MNDIFDLKGKTAVITGSSRGIGKAIAVRMAEYGAKVMISSRKIDACNQVVDEIKALGGEAYAEECNISSKDALQNLCDVSYKKLGKVDILVLNAASNPYYGPLAKISDEAFDKVMNNNVKSNLWLSNMIIPKMAEAGGGKVIVISSIAGITGTQSAAAASIEKAVQQIKSKSDLPVAVGFGIKTREQVKEIGNIAEGVVVGSAIVNEIEQNLDANGQPKAELVERVISLVQSLAADSI